MGNCCGKILQEIVAGKSRRKFLPEILAGKSCGKFLWENLVGNGGGEKANLRKAVIIGNLAFGIGLMGSQPIRIQLGKILREKSCGKCLAGKSCGKWRRGKNQFKKGSDWWKFSIWNRVMGSQPIRIQLGKILWKNLVVNSCGKFLWEILRENLVGNSYRKLLQENLGGNSCGKILWENLVGNGGGEKANLRKAVIGGNLAFGIG